MYTTSVQRAQSTVPSSLTESNGSRMPNTVSGTESREATGDGIESRLRGWIASQGFPLEMRVAEILRSSAVGWDHGRVYQDPETGKVREIDVVGYFDNRPFSTHAVFECKHSDGKPWVAFATGGSQLLPEGQLLSIPATPRMRKALEANISDVMALSLNSFPVSQEIAFRLAKAWTPQQDAAFHAIAGVSAAANSIADYIGKWNHAVLYIPIVVIDTPLYLCTPQSESDFQLREVTHAVVSHTPQPGNHVPVSVVTIEGLRSLVAIMRSDATRLSATLNRNP